MDARTRLGLRRGVPNCEPRPRRARESPRPGAWSLPRRSRSSRRPAGPACCLRAVGHLRRRRPLSAAAHLRRPRPPRRPRPLRTRAGCRALGPRPLHRVVSDFKGFRSFSLFNQSKFPLKICLRAIDVAENPGYVVHNLFTHLITPQRRPECLLCTCLMLGPLD